MTIYIYGSKSFKNNIHEVLDHANMKFRLSDDDSIVELNSLKKLKEAIEEDPKDIFLIDDEKIIKKNSLNDKIKFLKPKDGIEEEFLKEHGIGDLSVGDIHEIAIHIIKKLEKAHALKEKLDENYIEKQNNEIASKNDEYSFVHGATKEKKSVDEYEEDDFLKNYKTFEDIEDEENHDDELSDDTIDEDDDFDIDDVINFEDEIPLESSLDEELELPNDDLKSLDNDLDEEDFGLTVEKIEQKGEIKMPDEFSELDSLNEDELLEALSGSSSSKSNKVSHESTKKSGAEVELNSSSVHEISSLITQLLNNKTLEITIKIKE